jgi:hypothetical protein
MSFSIGSADPKQQYVGGASGWVGTVNVGELTDTRVHGTFTFMLDGVEVRSGTFDVPFVDRDAANRTADFDFRR